MRASTLGVSAAELTALISTATVAAFGIFLSPLLVGGWIDSSGLSSANAGGLVTSELLISALAGMGVARWLSALSPHQWLNIGIVALGCGNLVCAFADNFEVLLAARGLSGVGTGIVFALFAAAVAGTPQPERLFALISVLQGILVALLLGVLPLAANAWGFAAVFYIIAFSCLLTLVLTRHWPTGDVEKHEHEDGFGAWAPGISLLGGALLISAVGMGIWAFSQQIGLKAGLSDEAIGVVLGVSTLAGLAGAALAGVLGTRWGRGGPIAAGVIVSTLSMAALTTYYTGFAFSTGQIVWGVAYYFVTPYVLGQAAVLDDAGRWAAAATGVNNLGAALGPVAFGALLATQWTTTAVLAAGFASLILLTLSVRLTKTPAAEPASRLAENPAD